MLKKIVKFSNLIFLLLLFCTGCWDAVDLEDKDITTVVIVDKTGGGYSFTLELADISYGKESGNGNGGSQNAQKHSILKSEGANYTEAREDLDRKADKPIYLGAVNTVVLTQNLAYYGIKEYMFRLRQITDYRKTVDVVITPERPEDLLNVKPEHASGVGMAIEDTLQSLVNTGQTFHMNLGDILEALASPVSCYLLATIGIRDDEIALIGYSAFDDGQCIAFIPIEQAQGIVMLKAKDPRRDYTVPCKNGHVTIHTRIRKKSIKPSFANGKISYKLHFYIDAELLYPANNIPITEEMDKQIALDLKDMMKKEVEFTIKQAREEYECDYLGFSTSFRIRYPEEFKKMDWEKEFPKAEFAIDLTIDHESVGNLDYKPATEH